MNDQPIGVFDSGIGGLTVAQAILKLLPNESIIYIGDTARVPYGSRGQKIITQFALELTQFLLEKKVKALVVACNTISATCLKEISEKSSVPVINVINPTVEEAVATTKNKLIGVVGTRTTINSGVYKREIQKLDPKIKVYSIACPLFVPLAEEGFVNHPATVAIAKDYLRGFAGTKIDTLILGCTHYPLLKDVIQKIVGQDVTLIDSATPTAKKLQKVLQKTQTQSEKTKGEHKFYVTDAPERVYKVADWFFQAPVPGKLEKV